MIDTFTEINNLVIDLLATSLCLCLPLEIPGCTCVFYS